MADDADKKIIIDEDWKAQVQREKDEAAKKAQEQPSEAQPASSAGEEDVAGAAEQAQEEGASFMSLVGSLVTQVMFALGVIAPEGAKQVQVDLEQGRYLIDLLSMLRDKTQGNLTDEESRELTQAISELQQVYMARAQQAQQSALQQTGIDPKNLKHNQ